MSQEKAAYGSTKKHNDPFQYRTSTLSLVNDEAAVEDSGDFSLTKMIQCVEQKLNDAAIHEKVVDDVPNTGGNIGSGPQKQLLQAVPLVREKLDELLHESRKKDDEIRKLKAKIKEIEGDRSRLQKTTTIQQTQLEKHKALAEESANKCNCLQVQLTGLHKELESLNKSQKEAARGHSTTEIRLNRALEETEQLKSQLSKMQEMSKEKMKKELQSKENLIAENKTLKKQKAELIGGFKRQLKLIDILKREKMHFEAAKLLSFTEDDFMKALDWGNA
ncbi:testis-expressed protein 9 isoform X2 [Thalassophryne amazonica]|uniref:testis-expressed protein 9 isoform X2 n=1 Tax=Thalassophryne amazonica TaxID=390379 RepID=UPI001470A7E2|nr:testis-expressed protein 9 isoform X2 [Thalassophryne amazonica]